MGFPLHACMCGTGPAYLSTWYGGKDSLSRAVFPTPKPEHFRKPLP